MAADFKVLLLSYENCVHEGVLLLVDSSSKGCHRMGCFHSYCRILTLGILVFLCRIEKQENISIISGELFLSILQ